MRRLLVACTTLMLAACATPYVQSPLTPPEGFAGPRVEAAATGLEGALVMADGARLPLLRWAPEAGEPWAVVVALHGMNDHNASFRLAGPWWATRGIETWAYDQRGFGGAPGRGTWAGEDLMVGDLRTAVALARQAHPRAVVAVVGESMGGSVAAAAFASDRPPAADRVVLLAPGVWGWSSQNAFNRVGLWVAARALGERAVQPPEFVTRRIRASDNLIELLRNGRDPETILSTRFDTLSGLVSLMETASNSLGRSEVPTLLLYGDHDQIVEKGPMRRALARAGDRPGFRTGFYADAWHIMNRDLGGEVVYRDVEAYLRDAAAPLPSGAPPVAESLNRR